MSPSYYTVFFFLFARKYPRNRERSTNTTIVIVEERDKQASRLVQYRENGVADTATNIRGKNKNKTCWLTRFAKQLSLSLSLSLSHVPRSRTFTLSSFLAVHSSGSETGGQKPLLAPAREHWSSSPRDHDHMCHWTPRNNPVYPCSSWSKGEIRSDPVWPDDWMAGPRRYVWFTARPTHGFSTEVVVSQFYTRLELSSTVRFGVMDRDLRTARPTVRSSSMITRQRWTDG